MNEQLSEDLYRARMERETREQMIPRYRKNVEALKMHCCRRSRHGEHIERSTGDYLFHVQDCEQCFDVLNVEKGKYLFNVYDAHSCVDATYVDSNSKFLLDVLSVAGEQCTATTFVWFSHDCHYCFNCHNAANLFGCAQMRGENYCILNKQYSKEEYAALIPKIIERMKADGEWGEFFPIAMSPFAYNETVAHEYYPLTKEEVLERRWKWREQVDEIPKVDRIIPAKQLPELIEKIPDDILRWAIECDATKRPFRITRQELDFFRQMKLPIPHLHPDERHRRRMALRNPRRLWARTCMKCGGGIVTTYAPERVEIVYCEECYLQSVY